MSEHSQKEPSFDLESETMGALRERAEASGLSVEDFYKRMYEEGRLRSPDVPEIPSPFTVTLEGETAERFAAAAERAGLSHEEYAIQILKDELKRIIDEDEASSGVKA